MILRGLKQGMTSGEIALQMAPDDEARQKYIRGLARRLLAQHPELQERQHTEVHGILQEGLIPATEALARRAARGRPDAIKLLYEASGFHNPKVKHEHSGDIQINLNMPRPPVQETKTAGPGNELEDGSIVDAEVVED